MTQTLKDLARGSIFPYAGYNWIALETQEAGTLVVMADILKNAPFDEDDNADWRESSARHWLNETFIDELTEAAADAGQAIIEATIDITADDGTFRETSIDRVFLLSCDEYRRNRDIIEPLGRWWWTRTRWSASYSYHVRRVRTGGALSFSNAYYGNSGLRPALLLSSDLLISDYPDEVAGLTEDDIETLARAVARIAPAVGIPAMKAVARAIELANEYAAAEAEARAMGEGDD